LQGDLGFIFFPPKKTSSPSPPLFAKTGLSPANNPPLFRNNPRLFGNNHRLLITSTKGPHTGTDRMSLISPANTI